MPAAARGQDNHRHGQPGLPPSSQDREAVDARQTEVENDRVILFGLTEEIGPLAIGNVKYKVEFGLFKKMIEAEKTVTFDFQDAFSLAREFAK